MNITLILTSVLKELWCDKIVFFVRAPFIVEGLLLGFFGAVIPLAAMIVILQTWTAVSEYKL